MPVRRQAPRVAVQRGSAPLRSGRLGSAALLSAAGAEGFVAGAGTVSNSDGLPGSSTMASTWPAGFAGTETTAVCAEAMTALPGVVERSKIV